MTEQSTAHHLREYETIFLVKPDLTDEGVDRVKDRVRGIVTREGGKLIRFTVWGKKKTMYPVAKQPRAIYVHASYLGGQALVAEVRGVDVDGPGLLGHGIHGLLLEIGRAHV